MIRRALPALLAGLLGAGGAHAAQADHVHAGGAWIRLLPAGLPAGGYVVLRNDADRPVVLREASSPAYGHVMLHRSTSETGMARMNAVASLDIPAHGTVALAPGGYHLMLMEATQPVQAGQTVTIRLHFADGSTLDAGFLARPANATGPADGG
ncbi:copper chaperone PCu(A)C [Frateuria defendens]|uniref:copper chaperone PCu(A)C n=1 Tax=Frateuria defendens TaxID=2219559 RepID=UPI00066FB365|nr:copper chaperone PCu(A)C [Frateuria defendens]